MNMQDFMDSVKITPQERKERKLTQTLKEEEVKGPDGQVTKVKTVVATNTKVPVKGFMASRGRWAAWGPDAATAKVNLAKLVQVEDPQLTDPLSDYGVRVRAPKAKGGKRVASKK